MSVVKNVSYEVHNSLATAARTQTSNLSTEGNVAMERNVAYELSMPLPQRLAGKIQTSQLSTAIYEDLQ